MTNPMNRILPSDVDRFRVEFNMKVNGLDEYQRIATKSAIYPGRGTPLGLDYVALKLNGESGEVAEHVGKAMRDEELIKVVEMFDDGSVRVMFGRLNGDRRENIIKEVGDVLWYLSAICNEIGINLSYAALENLIKLHDRTVRDTLRGSGDNR